MTNTFEKILSVALPLAVVVLGATPAAGHTASASAPAYSEEALTWCGPATAQMVMEGYPAGACTHLQADIAASISLHQVESGWDTDPAGMRGALLSLCPPAHTWAVFSRSNQDDLMYSVAFWLTQNQYPVALLLDTSAHRPTVPAHQEHWVMVEGVTTDINPVGNSSVVLQFVQYTDPSPPTFGGMPIESVVSGGTWATLFQPVAKPGSAYDGKYVAVIEPPETRGVVRVRMPPITGRVIQPREAMERAVEWIREIDLLRKIEAFEDLSRARPLEPLLVNPERGGYYLVPFSYQGETAARAVLVNAYDGSFQGVGAFEPQRYLSEQEAVQHAGKLLGRGREPVRPKATLVYAPEAGSASLFHPVWKVNDGERVVAVEQSGKARAWPRKERPERPVRPQRPGGSR